MAKFVFKMQSVLTVKEKLEDQAKQNYGAMLHHLQQEQEELEHRIKRESEYREEGRKLRESVLNITSLRENEAALKYMEQAILQQRHRVKKAESQVETARARLQEAMIERKTYEKLKEKAFEEFKKEVAKEENKETDELVSYVYGRRAMQENRS